MTRSAQFSLDGDRIWRGGDGAEVPRCADLAAEEERRAPRRARSGREQGEKQHDFLGATKESMICDDVGPSDSDRHRSSKSTSPLHIKKLRIRHGAGQRRPRPPGAPPQHLREGQGVRVRLVRGDQHGPRSGRVSAVCAAAKQAVRDLFGVRRTHAQGRVFRDSDPATVTYDHYRSRMNDVGTWRDIAPCH